MFASMVRNTGYVDVVLSNDVVHLHSSIPVGTVDNSSCIDADSCVAAAFSIRAPDYIHPDTHTSFAIYGVSPVVFPSTNTDYL